MTGRTPKGLKKTTLAGFFKAQGKGSQKRLSEAIGVTKGAISNMVAEPCRHYPTYATAKRIRSHLEAHGYTIDIESLVRTEEAPR